MAPGGGDQHVATKAATAHRLHGVVQVAQRGADLDLHRRQLGFGLALGFGAEPGAALDRGNLRFADLVDHDAGLAAGVTADVGIGVLVAQHRAGGHVDGVQHCIRAGRGDGLATQHAAAELELGVAVGFGQVGSHRITHTPAQVSLPLVGRQAADHAIELLEQVGVGQRDQVVVDALSPQEGIQLQVAVAAVEVAGGDRCVVVERVVDVGHRMRAARQFGFQLDDQRRFGIELRSRGAGQRQDLLHVGAVAAHQCDGVGIGAGIEGRVRQTGAALHEIADMAIQRLQVHIRGKVECHRDAHLVQGGDRGWDVLGLLDGIDAGQQRSDGLGAVGLDRGFIQAAGPEVAQQLLHVALRGAHRALQQLTLLVAGIAGQQAERADRAGLRHRVGLEPVGVAELVKIRTGRAYRRCARGRFLAGRLGVGRGQGCHQAEGQGERKRANVWHVVHIRRRTKWAEFNKLAREWRRRGHGFGRRIQTRAACDA